MAFSSFGNLQDVAVQFQIHLELENFVEPIPFPVDDRFREDLDFVLRNIHVSMSEAAVCEFMIAPVLTRIWRSYSDVLSMWSHIPLGRKEPLVGVPDYFFCRRSPLGVVVVDRPFIVVIEAKKDDFEWGWGQGLAAMLAAQEMNEKNSVTVYGCVSNGQFWQFGKLANKSFQQELQGFTLGDLSGLFAAWNFVLGQARQQVLAFAA